MSTDVLLLIAGSALAGSPNVASSSPEVDPALAASGQASVRAAALKDYFYYQGATPLCAFFTEKAVLEAYTGEVLPADLLLGWYAASGTLDVDAMGVPVSKVGEAMKVKGVPSTRASLSRETLQTALSRGHAVMAVVNPLYYWAPGDPMVDFYVDLQRRQGLTGANHLVWITDLTPCCAIINDSALRDGAGLAIEWTQFARAWAASGNLAVVSPRILPPLDPDGDGIVLKDGDRDGFGSDRTGGRDCNDANPRVNPAAAEVSYNGIDDDCDGGDETDRDRDGYPGAATPGRPGGDCDDNDATVHPGAEDTCYDERDSDCGGDNDFDCDSDGWAAIDDCDDSQPNTHPAAAEVCDGLDNDCDGATDSEDDRIAGSLVTFWADSDGDGFGTPGVSRRACPGEPPDGFSARGNDCDDSRPEVSPEGAETCDGRDNDCDGLIDGADDIIGGGIYCYRDRDHDGYGDPLTESLRCQCDEPEWTPNRRDCDDRDSGRNLTCVSEPP